MQLESTLTCPGCGHAELEVMPTDACQWFYDCKGCGVVLKPKQGDCCVFCSYGGGLPAGPGERQRLLRLAARRGPKAAPQHAGLGPFRHRRGARALDRR